MNDEEARALLHQHISEWRNRTWNELRAIMGEPQVCEVKGPSGARYTIEVEAFWDAGPEGNFRVLGSIDDGGWRAFKPLCEEFIKTPTGTFVGE